MDTHERRETLAVVRRLYLYGVAFVTLWLLTFSLAGLVDLAVLALFERWLVGPLEYVPPELLAGRLRTGIQYSALALPLWLMHVGLAQWFAVRDGNTERRSAIRRTYLYSVLATHGLLLALMLLWAVGGLLSVMVQGHTLRDIVNDYDSLFSLTLALALLTGAFWTLHAWIAQGDARVLGRTGWTFGLRRGSMLAVLSASGLVVLLLTTVGVVVR